MQMDNAGIVEKPKDQRSPKRVLAVGELVSDRWKVIRLLGEGGFGAVYEVQDTKHDALLHKPPLQLDDLYATKVEGMELPPNEQFLKMDVNILRKLASKHFCQFVHVGVTERFRYMVTQLVGPNLHDLKKRHGGKFKLRTMAHVGISSLEAIRDVHQIGYLHRDLKPANLAIGRPPHFRELYLLDFGLSRQYKHDDGRLRRPRDKANFRGTIRYAPVACHKGEETSRASDLWNWLYVVVELTVARLPWDAEIKRTREWSVRDSIERIGLIKEAFLTAPTELLHGCPKEYMTLHEHLSTLMYESEPKYDEMLATLKSLEERRRSDQKDGEKLDWENGQRSNAE